jgi:hypothetical protein
MKPPPISQFRRCGRRWLPDDVLTTLASGEGDENHEKKRVDVHFLGACILVLLTNTGLSAASGNQAPTVWTMSNDPAGNAVLGFALINGRLTALGSVPTGGTGSGGREPDFGLGNAHAIVLSSNNSRMYVVIPVVMTFLFLRSTIAVSSCCNASLQAANNP